MGLYEYENQDPSYPDKWKDENVKEYKEAIFNRISQLLIEKWTEIEPWLVPDINEDGTINILDVAAGSNMDLTIIKTLQKTIRDQEIQVGIQSEDESIIIYQSDTEANNEDKDIVESIFRFFNFAHPMHITLEIITNGTSTPNNISSMMRLKLKNSGDISSTFIVDEISTGKLKNLKLKDNISQFIEISKVKTNININKLSEYVDSTFTEIKPKT